MEAFAWLWPEGQHLRGWTPDCTKRFADLAYFDLVAATCDPHRVVTGAVQLPLETALPQPLATWLMARLNQHQRLTLRLSADLPPPWRRFPYEWLTLDGQPLHGRLRIWRHVPRTAEPFPPTPPALVALLNLWPPEEATQPLERFPLSPAQVYRYDGRCWVEALLCNQDPRAFSALCLIAHGSEQAEGLPFRLADGTCWELPPTRPLPPLVILLACGDCDGHLLDYAATLLQRGAHTVLAALGKLDARDVAVLLPKLLQGWLEEKPIGAVLDAAQAAIQWQGRGRLCLLGTGELRMSAAVTPVALLPTPQLAEHTCAGETAALQALLPRLTLECFLDTGESSRASAGLREHLGVPELGAPTENRHLLQRLSPLATDLPLLTRLWVLPLLTHLAEQHDHERLNDCRRQLAQLAQAHPEFAGLYADWAKAEYRRGHYAKAAQAALDGLRCTRSVDENSIRLLGMWVLILLDLNMREPVQALLDLRDRQLDQVGEGFASQERFKDMDSRGRLALRRSQYAEARVRFSRKRNQAAEHQENGRRELAWLLYATALLGPTQDGAEYAEESQRILANRPQIGAGNDDVLYLLRALAAWGWRWQDAHAWATLMTWLPELTDRLDKHQDTGPVGFALAYLHLCQRDQSNTLPSWDSIQAALADDRYFLELAIFNRLLNQPPAETKRWLNRYHQERREAMCTLMPDNLPEWLQSELPTIELDDVHDQEAQECRLLNATTPPDWDALCSAHLLPW